MNKEYFNNKPVELEKVYAYIQKHKLFYPNQKILCALSGGADSLCMLHILLQLAPIFNWKILALHLNHHLRGHESDADEAFCREICAEWGAELAVRDLDCGKKPGISLEEDARNQRYSAFSAVCSEHACDAVATAHTLSDQAETIILRMCRGTGLHGLRGIPAKRAIDDYSHSTNVKQNTFYVARPLLTLTRNEVEAYLKAYNQPFASDSTNTDTAFARNRVRCNIVPEMQKINEKALINICRLSDIVSQENEYLELQASDAFSKCAKFSHSNPVFPSSIDLKKILTFHVAIQQRVIIKLLEQNQIDCTSDLVEKIMQLLDFCKSSGDILHFIKKLQLRGPSRSIEKILEKASQSSAYLTVNEGTLSIEHVSEAPESFKLKVQLPGATTEGTQNLLKIPCPEAKKCLNLRFWQYTQGNISPEENIYRKFANTVVECGKLKGDIYLRNRRPGDRLRLPQRGFSCDLRKKFQAVEAQARPFLLVLADDDGPFFAETVGIDERVAPESSGSAGNDSRLFMEISVTPLEPDSN